VLGLIEDHPEHHLVLPLHDGEKANLSGIDLSRETLEKIRTQPEAKATMLGSRTDRQLLFANLQGANLDDANLQGVFLAFANLQGAHFQRANLQGAYLQKAVFDGANLKNAHLGNSNLQGASLQSADLQNARLDGADLQSANFQGAKLQGVDLSEVRNLSNVYLSRAWLVRTRMRRKDLGNVIGEELDHDYANAKDGYLILKQNFDDLGDYDAASWAYRKERRMEKLEAWQNGRPAIFPIYTSHNRTGC